MSKNPAADIAAYLDKKQVGVHNGENGDDNIFVGPVRPVSEHVPADAVFVLAYGGQPSEPYHSEKRISEIRYPSVQVTVRWSEFSAGYTKAINVLDILTFALINGYLGTECMHSEPNFLGQDQNGNYRWSLNFRVTYGAEAD